MVGPGNSTWVEEGRREYFNPDIYRGNQRLALVPLLAGTELELLFSGNFARCLRDLG
jgi:hypothetical protein